MITYRPSFARPWGYSLLELLITISISSILLTAAIPSFGHMKAKSNAKTISSTLTRMLAKARSYAIFHSAIVTICGVDEQYECSNRQFEKILVFVDENENRTLDEEEKVIQEAVLKYQGQLNLRAALGRRYFQFTHSGSSKQAGSFIYCDPDYSSASRRITVSMTGRAYIAQDEDNDGVVELTNGDPITCS